MILACLVFDESPGRRPSALAGREVTTSRRRGPLRDASPPARRSPDGDGAGQPRVAQPSETFEQASLSRGLDPKPPRIRLPWWHPTRTSLAPQFMTVGIDNDP